jgi:hypothetical protein
MPTAGSYEFKLAAAAKDGFIPDSNIDLMKPGEWAWIDRSAEFADLADSYFLMIYARCPDCGQLMTLYRKRGESEPQGHKIDPHGNVSPSVLHTWQVSGVEQCGFHTIPTRLQGFIDKRKP